MAADLYPTVGIVVPSVIRNRAIARLEREIGAKYDEASHAYWHVGNLACQKIEREIAELERQLAAI